MTVCIISYRLGVCPVYSGKNADPNDSVMTPIMGVVKSKYFPPLKGKNYNL